MKMQVHEMPKPLYSPMLKIDGTKIFLFTPNKIKIKFDQKLSQTQNLKTCLFSKIRSINYQ